LPWWIQSNWIEFFLQHVSSAHFSEFNPIEFFCTMFQKCSLRWIQSNWIFLQHVSKCSLGWIQSNWIFLRCNWIFLTTRVCILFFLANNMLQVLGEFELIFYFFCNTTLLEFKYFLLSVLWSLSIYLSLNFF
jgi:hypothetical protein